MKVDRVSCVSQDRDIERVARFLLMLTCSGASDVALSVMTSGDVLSTMPLGRPGEPRNDLMNVIRSEPQRNAYYVSNPECPRKYARLRKVFRRSMTGLARRD